MLEQNSPAQWHLKRPDGSQIPFSHWNAEAKASKCFSAILVPEPEPLPDLIGPNDFIEFPVSHTHLELRWYEREGSKKKSKYTVLRTRSVLAPKECTISDLVDFLGFPSKVSRLKVFFWSSEGFYTTQIYPSHDGRKISELFCCQGLQMALDVGGSGKFPEFEEP